MNEKMHVYIQRLSKTERRIMQNRFLLDSDMYTGMNENTMKI